MRVMLSNGSANSHASNGSAAIALLVVSAPWVFSNVRPLTGGALLSNRSLGEAVMNSRRAYWWHAQEPGEYR
jgi:hypothetical protein